MGKGRGDRVVKERTPKTSRRKTTDAQARKLAAEANFLPDADVSFKSLATPWPGICLNEGCGERITPRLKSVLKGERACKFCSYKVRAISRRVDIGEAFKNARESQFTPDGPPPNSVMTPWPGTCDVCGERVQPRLSWLRRENRSGVACKACADRESGERKRAKVAEAAFEEMVAAGARPVSREFPGAKAAWESVCLNSDCGKVIFPNLARIRRRQSRACTICAAKESMDRHRKGRHGETAAYMISKGFTPLETYPGANAPWKCRCNCGAIARVAYGNVTQGQRGCRSCCDHGYRPVKPGYIYLMTRTGEQQVGISNVPKKRLATHHRNGWRLLDLSDAMPGQDAWDIEFAVKQWLKMNAYALPGGQEVWSTASFEVDKLQQLFRMAGVEEGPNAVTPPP